MDARFDITPIDQDDVVMTYPFDEDLLETVIEKVIETSVKYNLSYRQAAINTKTVVNALLAKYPRMTMTVQQKAYVRQKLSAHYRGIEIDE